MQRNAVHSGQRFFYIATLFSSTSENSNSLILRNQPGDKLQNHQMSRVEDIEEGLHVPFAPFAVVAQQQGDCRQSEHLFSSAGQPQKDQPKAQKQGAENSCVPFGVLGQGGKYRHHAAPEAVVDGKDPVQDKDGGNGGEKHRTPEGGGFPAEVLQGEDGEDRQGKGEKNGQVQTAVGQIVHYLAQHCQSKNIAEIPSAAVGVLAPFRDHKGKDGEGQPPQNPQDGILGKQQKSRVVNGHGQGGDELQGIARKKWMHKGTSCAGHGTCAFLLAEI